METYDLIVIGSGPSGRRAAVQAAKLGRSVMVIDKGRRLGGVSVHTGTIPSKTLRETVLNLSGWRERGFYGRGYRVKQDIVMADLIARLHKTLDHEVEVLQHQFMRNAVRSMKAVAKFVDANRVSLTTDAGVHSEVGFTNALVSVGTRPFRPNTVPFDGKRVFDSDDILELTTLPRTLTVVGGGVIGVEYATIFSALDVPVTLIESRQTILDFVDRELVDDFMHQLRDRGVTLRLGAAVKEVKVGPTGVETLLADGRVVRTDILLYAAGRSGNVGSLGLDAIGIKADSRGRIEVDPQTFQTSVPNIYATGDVIGFPSLASTSMEQGRVAACHAFGVPLPPPPATFPYGIYAVPEISTVGQSEEEVRRSGEPYECGVARFRETSRGHIMGVDSGFLKLVFSLATRRLLGAHIVGEGATELIHIGQAVINLGGTVDFFVNNTFNYPTLAEAYKIAGLDAWNRMGVGQ
ncbi:Si-specific NAD(P)(+) transhydrogenase [Mesorhizobium sp. LHD-90]|uniref:Si-specific NAD(P)(+) transhydrogenase n=1 Tax=Mesorhizobium sp. LHD-90 TaxID=3071414 RepID=UPI0027E20F91|nr:Si-specific NAD(P)(+) transhydrogenase [Mesorhizobium sp. LHD-90]MDQ6434502.1 Si-specific NAD(P)(+) transhydrogenase [Mesorhizobium sp. LHD-90]